MQRFVLFCNCNSSLRHATLFLRPDLNTLPSHKFTLHSASLSALPLHSSVLPASYFLIFKSVSLSPVHVSLPFYISPFQLTQMQLFFHQIKTLFHAASDEADEKGKVKEDQHSCPAFNQGLDQAKTIATGMNSCWNMPVQAVSLLNYLAPSEPSSCAK